MQSSELDTIMHRHNYDLHNTSQKIKELNKALKDEENKTPEDIDLRAISDAINSVDCSIVSLNTESASVEIFQSTFEDITSYYEEGKEFALKMAKKYNLPEDEIIEQHKKEFLEKLSEKDLGLSCTVAGGKAFQVKLAKFTAFNYPRYPEIVTMFLKDFYLHYSIDTIYASGMTKAGRLANYERFHTYTTYLDNPTPATEQLYTDIKKILTNDHRIRTFALNSADIIPEGASHLLKNIFETTISELQLDVEESQKTLKKVLNSGNINKTDLSDNTYVTNTDAANLILMHLNTFTKNKISVEIELEKHDFNTFKPLTRPERDKAFASTPNSEIYSWWIPERMAQLGPTYENKYNEQIEILNTIRLSKKMNSSFEQIAKDNMDIEKPTSPTFKL